MTFTFVFDVVVYPVLLICTVYAELAVSEPKYAAPHDDVVTDCEKPVLESVTVAPETYAPVVSRTVISTEFVELGPRYREFVYEVAGESEKEGA